MTLTGDELAVITACSRSHYDDKCRSISLPGQRGFLYGILNLAFHLALGPEDMTLKEIRNLAPQTEVLSWDELDTIAKCLENVRTWGRIYPRPSAVGGDEQ